MSHWPQSFGMCPYGVVPCWMRSAPITPAYPTSITLLLNALRPQRNAMSTTSTVTSAQVGIQPGSPGVRGVRVANGSAGSAAAPLPRAARARCVEIHTMRASR